MRRSLAALVSLLVLSGAARDPLEGRVAGAPARCISDSVATTGPSILDRHTIIFNGVGRRLWITHPQGECRALQPLNTLVIERWGGDLCANDRFRVLEPGTTIPSAYCRFGQFVPYDRPAH